LHPRDEVETVSPFRGTVSNRKDSFHLFPELRAPSAAGAPVPIRDEAEVRGDHPRHTVNPYFRAGRGVTR